MHLEDVYQNKERLGEHYLHYLEEERSFTVSSKRALEYKNRRTLFFVYQECIEKAAKRHGVDFKLANRFVRKVWKEKIHLARIKDLPGLVEKDTFLAMYILGRSLSVSQFSIVWEGLNEAIVEPLPRSLKFGETKDASIYYDVKATPPGILPKMLTQYRIRQDFELLKHVQSDLDHVQRMKDPKKRKTTTLAILSHGASYREMEGKILEIPSLVEGSKEMVPYRFKQHLLWEGIKTISAFPLKGREKHPGIYLCQGTEIWPSQPSMLGSIFANLGTEGCATEPYAFSWRQIHKHLRALSHRNGPLPIIAGHSMGGALAMQIALYSHGIIEKSYAFNPPVVEKRDYDVYHQLSKEAQKKILVFANLDDLPFWRIGSRVIGQVHVICSEKRWTYRPIKLWEIMTLFPALMKSVLNLIYSFPAHQSIFFLSRSYLIIPLSEEEIEQENRERVLRPDHIFFFPKLYHPARRLLHFARKHFKWELYEEYLKSQIEIIDLHCQDLQDALPPGKELNAALRELHRQKESLEISLKQLEKMEK